MKTFAAAILTAVALFPYDASAQGSPAKGRKSARTTKAKSRKKAPPTRKAAKGPEKARPAKAEKAGASVGEKTPATGKQAKGPTTSKAATAGKAKRSKKTRATKKAATRRRRRAKGKAKAEPEKKPAVAPVKKKKITKKQKAQAKRFFARGKKLFSRKKFAEAAEFFEKAYLIWKHKVIEYNLALAYAFKGDKVKAGIFVRKYLTKAKGKEKNLIPELQQVLEDTAVLSVRTPDPDAAILVDGRLVGRGTVEVVVEAGERAVDIAVNDRVVARRVIDLPPDGRKVWELFEVPTAPLPTRPGTRPAPRVRVAFRPGPVPAGPVYVPTPAGPSVWSRMRRLHWAYFVSAAGLAVAAAGAAAGMSVTIRKMDEDCRKAPCTNAEEKKGFTYQKVANAMWGVSGGAALAAAVLVIFTRWRKPEKAVSVAPAIGPQTVGLTVSFRR